MTKRLKFYAISSSSKQSLKYYPIYRSLHSIVKKKIVTYSSVGNGSSCNGYQTASRYACVTADDFWGTPEVTSPAGNMAASREPV